MSQREWEVAEAALAKPFNPSQIKFRAGATTKDKALAMALAYVDARDVMERLDTAVGRSGWSDAYWLMSETAVECSLTVLGVTKSDVGYPNSEDDEEPLKSAYSDAFKRAAVKFGIGRDLYAMPTRWVPYDAEHKRLILDGAAASAARPASSPALPSSAERVVNEHQERRMAQSSTAGSPPPPSDEPEAVQAAFAAFGDEIATVGASFCQKHQVQFMGTSGDYYHRLGDGSYCRPEGQPRRRSTA